MGWRPALTFSYSLMITKDTYGKFREGGSAGGPEVCEGRGRQQERQLAAVLRVRKRQLVATVSQLQFYCPVASGLKQFWGRRSRGAPAEKVGASSAFYSRKQLGKFVVTQ